MSKFNEETTALEVIKGINLNGYKVIVTGSSSGLGVETVRALAKAGANCVMAVRDVNKGKDIAQEIIKTTTNKNIQIEKLELDSIASVNSFVDRFLATQCPLHILINNAGVMATPKSYTRDGFETQFGVNHLGHFALTLGLLPALKKAAKLTGKYSRVINLSSTGHVMSNVDFDDVNFKHREYDEFVAYGQSKTANILFSVGLTNRYVHEGIVSNAVQPGAIMTNLQRHMSKEEWVKRGWIDENGKIAWKFRSVEAGAATTVWAASSPYLEGKGGLCLENCDISKREKNVANILRNRFGYMDYAVDEKNCEKLWKLSEELLKNKKIN
jgi:NAD(P)-dependent dehydrogenase (short-subunit alcohol dehydrogenase family)